MIGIVCVGQIELSPYVKKYIAVLEGNNISYEIVHWNRSGVKMPDDDKNHTFSEQLDRYGSLLKKAMPFFRFRRYLKKIIKQNKYDKLIILTTQTAIMIPDVLFRKYKNKYFFDYRDTSYEYLKPYKKLIDKIIVNSCFTCISSPGFKEYLTDKKELTVAHNFQDTYYNERVMQCTKSQADKIIIGYIGYLREYEYLKKLVTTFGKDARFEFHIHGSGDCVDKLREFSSSYKNIKVFGAYKEEDKMKIIDSFDMICYNYPYSFVNYPAVANKFYDGMIRKKPMFGNLNTYSGKLIQNNGLGISLPENEEDFAEKIFSYYRNLDEAEFTNKCESFLSKVLHEDDVYIKKIKSFVV